MKWKLFLEANFFVLFSKYIYQCVFNRNKLEEETMYISWTIYSIQTYREEEEELGCGFYIQRQSTTVINYMWREKNANYVY